MNKSAILSILAILLTISPVIGFDVLWYHYITYTLKTYGVSDSDIIKRLDVFFFTLGLEVFFATIGTIISLPFASENSSGSAWPF